MNVEKQFQQISPRMIQSKREGESTLKMADFRTETTVQAKLVEAIQRQEDDEELMQGKFVSQLSDDEDELLQRKFTGQLQTDDDDGMLQGKFKSVQQQTENHTGIPDAVKQRIDFKRQTALLKTIQGKGISSSTRGVIQRRIPNLNELNTLKDKLTPEQIRAKVEILILGMTDETGHLWVLDYVERLVQSDGSINEGEYNWCFGTGKKEQVYGDPQKTDTKFESGDMGKLKKVLEGARQAVEGAGAYSIFNVFGGKYSDAKGNYGKIVSKIKQIDEDDRVNVTTDYNGEDAQIGVGGYAVFDEQKVHFDSSICEDIPENKMTVVHECAHLVDHAIVDKGYFGSSGFQDMSEDDKVHNAAHYEVAPGWQLGVENPYPKDLIFQYKPPGVQTPQEQGQREASEYLREAWDAACDCVVFLRQRLNQVPPPGLSKIEAFSERLGLTVHLQKGTHGVTLLDVTLMEKVAGEVAGIDCKDIDVPADRHDHFKDFFIDEALKGVAGSGIDRNLLDYLISRTLFS